MNSLAQPSVTPGGVHELVRRWEPSGDARAEMVLCHGLAEHSGRYEQVGERFSAAGIGVTAYDQIGFGASGGKRAWVDEWSDVLDQIQRHIEVARETTRPVVLLGHSTGGLFALEYALAERPRPDLLVLSAPVLDGGARWQKVLAAILDVVAPSIQIPNKLKGEELSRDPAVGEAYFSDPLVLTKTTGHFGKEMLNAMARVNAVLSDLSVPTLVVHGAVDQIVPPQSSAPLADIPGVDRRLYPVLRHELFNEPEGMEVVDDVIGWINAKLA